MNPTGRVFQCFQFRLTAEANTVCCWNQDKAKEQYRAQATSQQQTQVKQNLKSYQNWSMCKVKQLEKKSSHPCTDWKILAFPFEFKSANMEVKNWMLHYRATRAWFSHVASMHKNVLSFCWDPSTDNVVQASQRNGPEKRPAMRTTTQFDIVAWG